MHKILSKLQDLINELAMKNKKNETYYKLIEIRDQLIFFQEVMLTFL